MSTRYSVGIMNQLGDALEAAGYSVDDVTKLHSFAGLGDFKEVVSGNSKIVVVRRVLTLVRTSLWSAATCIGTGWSTWLGGKTGDGLSGEPARDKRSLALTEIDLSKIQFKSYLADGETVITGEERSMVMKACGDIGLDAQVGWDLYKEPGQKSLRWLYDHKGVTWVEFPGEVLRGPGGHRYFLCLFRQGDGRWDWYRRCLGNGRGASVPAAVLSNS